MDNIWTIYTVYLSLTAMIKINGSLSKRIALKEGCKHGCPMSPSLFNLFIEPLAWIMKNNQDIHRRLAKGERNKRILGKPYNVTTIEQRWEKEMKIGTPEAWLHTWETQCTTTNSLTCREFNSILLTLK